MGEAKNRKAEIEELKKYKANKYNLMVQEVETAISARLNDDTDENAGEVIQVLQLFLKEGRVLDIATMEDGRRAATFAFRGKQISIPLSPCDGEPDPEALAKFAPKNNGLNCETLIYVADDAMTPVPSEKEVEVVVQKLMLSVTRKPGEDIKILRAVTKEGFQCVLMVDWEENKIMFYVSDNEDRAKKEYVDWSIGMTAFLLL
jgi:hypothetical protein